MPPTRLVAAALAAVLALAVAPAATATPADPSTPADRPAPTDPQVERAARLHDLPEAAVRGMLRRDEALRLGTDGRLFYVDTAAHEVAESTGTTTSTVPPPAYPTSQTFLLHSRPGATRTIHLDFDGHTVSGTWWNQQLGVAERFHPGLDADGNPSAFGLDEHGIIQDAWRRVAEDFAPYDVDVTTEDPGGAALTRSSGTDQRYGMRAIVTRSVQASDVICGSRCIGVAALDVFDHVPRSGEAADHLQPAWTFSHVARNDSIQIAETITHEVGHTLALVHDADATHDYHLGNGFWSPIMGQSWGALTQFSKGEYTGAVNYDGFEQQIALQDDFAVMDAAGVDFRADDHGGPAQPTRISTTATGVIARATDTDWFEVGQTCAAPLSVRVTPAPVGPNLDVRLTVRDPLTGLTVATLDPLATNLTSLFLAHGLDATWSPGELPSGRWLVGVDGTGQGDPLTGYSDYGSVGQYSVHVATPCPLDAPPSAPTRLAGSATPTSLTVSWQPPAGTGGAITAYLLTAGGGTVRLDPSARSHTLTGLAPGTSHPVSVAAVNAHGTGPAALASFRTSTTKPGRPGIGRAKPGPLGGRLTATARWTAPASTGGTPITGYRVIALKVARDGRVLDRRGFDAGPDRRARRMRLARGAYRFRVRALNTVGASRPSALSNRVRAR